MHTPEEIHEITANTGAKKVAKPLMEKLVLGFVAGALIAIGYLGYLRVVAGASPDFGGIATFIGAAVFPVGLVGILMGGGELATGNMMAVSHALYSKKISIKDFILNIVTISLANLVGALFVAYFLGHLTGITSTGVMLETTINVATSKTDASFWAAFLSGVGCNWLVGLSVWLNYGAKDSGGRVLLIWFPIMTFVLIGFQHSIANMYVVPAAIFGGGSTWGAFWTNLLAVWLGNILGGSGFVSYLYHLGYKRSSNKPIEAKTN